MSHKAITFAEAVKPITFAEAFKFQLERTKPLTESDLTEMKLKVCGITNEELKPGDTIIHLILPEKKENNVIFARLLQAKKETVEAKNWSFYPLEGENEIPMVDSDVILK